MSPSASLDSGTRLGRLSLFALALNGIVGVGIFFAPASIATQGGASSLLPAFALAFAAFLPSLGVFAALATLLPQDGGPAAHARAMFGARAGFFVGTLGYVAALASTAAVLRGLGDALDAAQGRGVALALLLVFGGFALCGLRVSAAVWSTLTVLKVSGFAAFLVAVLVRLASVSHAAIPVATWPAGSSVLVAAFCFQGFEVTSVLAGRGAAGRAMVEAFGTAAALYIVFVWAAGGLWASGAVPFAPADAYGGLAVTFGQRFSWVLGAVVSLSSAGIAFGMVAMTPRYATAAWPSLSFTRAAILTMALVAVLLAADTLAQLFALATLAVVAQYAASACALWARSTQPWLRAIVVASLGNSLVLAAASSAREGLFFAVVVFAAGALSRTVTEPTPFRHTPPCPTSPPADERSSPSAP